MSAGPKASDVSSMVEEEVCVRSNLPIIDFETVDETTFEITFVDGSRFRVHTSKMEGE